MSVTIRQVAELYVATFNRAPDASGLAYWVNDSALAIEEIAMSFFDQPEAQALYPTGTTNTGFVTSIYSNLFNRTPDTAGLAYWVEELNNAHMTRSVMIEAMKNGALGTDALIISNKKTVGMAYAAAGLEGTTFSLNGITEDPSTVGVALGNISDLSSPGVTYLLTTDTNDFIIGTGGNDTFTVADGTLTATDIVVGLAGVDTMNITTTTAPAMASINGIENININWDATGTATINAANITGATITGTSAKAGFNGNMNVIVAGENRVIAGSGMVGTLTVTGATDGSVVDGGYATVINVSGTGAATVTAGTATTSVTTSGFSRSIIDAGTATDIHITDAGSTTDATILIVNADATINATTGSITGSLAMTAHDGNDLTVNTIGNGLAINGTGNVTVTSNGLSNETVLDNKTSGTLTIIDTSGNAAEVLTNIHADAIRLANAHTTQVTVSSGQHLETTLANTSITLLDGASAPSSTNTVTVTNTAAVQTSIVATAFSTLNLVSNAAAISGTDATYTTLTNAGHMINLSGTNDVVVSNVTAATFDASELNGNLTYTQASAGATTVLGSTGTNAVVFKGTTQDNSFTGQNGADSVVFVTTTGHAVANLGEGNNAVAITGSLSGSGTLTINAGSGNDTVAFGDSTVTGTATIATGAGTDVISVTNATDLSGATLSMSGIDTIQVAAGHGSTWAASDLSGFTFTLKGVGTLSSGVLTDGLSVVGDVASGQTIDMSHLVLDTTVAAGVGGIYITGNAGNDTITGTSGRDTISGGAGNDTIRLTETTAVADTVILNDRATNGTDTITSFAAGAGADLVKLVSDATKVQTTTDVAALDSVDVALTNGAAAYVLGTGIGGLTTNTADIIEINTTLSSFGNLSATGVSNGSELLKALSSTATAASSITASNGSNFYIVAYQGGNAYLYQVFNNTDATVTASEIALVSVFEGVTAGSFASGDFITDRYVAPTPPPPPADTTAPTLSSSTPADGALSVGVGDNIVLTFNESIVLGTGNIVLKDAGNTVIETFNVLTGLGSAGGRVTASGSTVTVNPGDSLTAGTSYYVTVASTAVKDTAGNVYAGITLATDLNFTARAAGTAFNLVVVGAETITGDAGDNTITAATFANGGTGTFNTTDIISGGAGFDTLVFTDTTAEDMVVSDGYWANVSGIEKIMTHQTAAGAIDITAGVNFNTAFASNGVVITTETGLAGASVIDMSAFTGDAIITATTGGAGAHTITTGSTASAISTVTSTTAAGDQTINGANLASVTATSNGGGIQIIGDAIGGGAHLVSVTAIQNGAGNQTITSTSGSAVTVNVTNSGTAGNQTIVTGAGADTITLSGTYLASVVNITAGAGADTITLKAGHSAINTIVETTASTGLPSITNVDTVTNYNKALDHISCSTLVASTQAIAGDATHATFTSSLATFTTGGDTFANHLAYVAAAQGAVAGQTAIWQEGADSYVFISDGVLAVGATDVLIKLVGVTAGALTIAGNEITVIA